MFKNDWESDKSVLFTQRNVKGERQNNENKTGLYNFSVDIEENKCRCCFD